jgi:hypothetical protein
MRIIFSMQSIMNRLLNWDPSGDLMSIFFDARTALSWLSQYCVFAFPFAHGCFMAFLKGFGSLVVESFS